MVDNKIHDLRMSIININKEIKEGIKERKEVESYIKDMRKEKKELKVNLMRAIVEKNDASLGVNE